MQIAAQLYTVRDFTQNEKDFAETIKKIAAIGYPGVQLSAHNQEIPAKFIADTCAANGVTIVSSHAPPARILNDTDTLIAEHKLYNAPQIGIGMIPEEYRADLAGVKKFIADFLPAALKIKAAGLRFAYHNHEYEFGKFEGKMIIDYLMEGFAEADMQIILDTYWVQCGGCEPVSWIKKLAGKIPRMHFKDMAIVDRSQHFAEIGAGNLNWPEIIAACKASGVEWVIVEQDDSYGRDSFDSLRESYEFLAKHI
ncbi:MAG: sugar phosphate isomerase/epimerase [Defluviitaleaceae bacterium]|nr:sugar phosphate isomerase/epimerase [Defluviitaleaceae bacterium]